jgi:eukaryotic-like serine/threonine-protein kinase
MSKKIANYNIIETISENGPVSVYQAVHTVLNRKTLLKVHHSDDKELIKRFEREARIVAELNHPSIVAIYDYGRASDKDFYISMEFIAGGNLNDYLEQNALSLDEKINLCYNIARCIAVIHKHGYIHRDLKPQNLLVDTDGSVKLTDFGISFHESLKRTTPDGRLLGTPLFMSPEQINNLPVTKLSDLYSLGVIFYQVLSSQNPFDAPNFGEIFSKILTYKPQSLNTLNSTIPDWFSELTDKLLSKEVQNRPVKIEEVLIVLNEGLNIQEKDDLEISVKKTKPNLFYFLIPAALLLIFMAYFIQKDEPSSPQSFPPDTVITTISEKGSSTVLGKDLIEDKTEIDSQKNHSSLPKKRLDREIIDPRKETKFFVNTYPWCRIYLDYKLIDTTPLKDSIVIKPGKYLLSLQNSAYPSWNDSIEITENRTNIFNYNLDSIFYKLELTVQPWGKVFIDGNYYGTTPLDKPIVLSKKNKTILIENQYYKSYTDTLFWTGKPLISKNIILDEKIKN